VLSQCQSSSTYESEINTIDSLQTTLTYIESKLDTFDYEGIKQEYVEIKSKYDYLLENYPDKDDRDFWINQMNYLRSVKKAFGNYAQEYPGIKEDLDYSRSQLLALKNSISDNKLTREEIEEYLATEREAVNQLRLKATRLKPSLEASSVIWDSIADDIDKVVLSLDSVSQD